MTELVGRVRLAALELLDRQRAGEAGQALDQIALERGDVEGVLLGDGLGAGVGFWRAHGDWGSWRADRAIRADPGQRSAIASSLSFDSTTSRVGSIRTAPVALEALQLLVDALARGAEQLGQVFLGELQADPDLVALLRRRSCAPAAGSAWPGAPRAAAC